MSALCIIVHGICNRVGKNTLRCVCGPTAMEELGPLKSPVDEVVAHNKQVEKAIRLVIKEHERKWSARRTDEMLTWFTHSTTLASLLCMVLYIVSLFFVNRAFQSTTRLIVEASIFLGLIVMNLLLRVYLAWLDHTAAVAPVRRLLNNFESTDTRLIEDVTLQLSVSTIKDMVRQTITKRTRAYRRQHPSPFDRILILVHDHVVFGLIISIVVTVIVAVVRIAVLPGDVRNQWVWLFFERLIYVILPLLEFVTPLAFFLASSLQNSRVLALHQVQQLTPQSKPHATDLNPWSPGGPSSSQKNDSSFDSSHTSTSRTHDRKGKTSSPSASSSSRSSSSISTESTDDDDSSGSSSSSDHLQYSVPVNSLGDLEAGKRQTASLSVPRRMAPAALVRDYLRRVITGDESLGCLPRNNVADLLANVTTLACIDQRPVREPHPFAEKVLILGRMRESRSGSQLVSSSLSVTDANEAAARNAIFTYDHMPKLRRGCTAYPIILHLQRKSSIELEFVDGGWRSFLPLLKPLGLNCMLTGAYSESQHDMDLSDFEEGLRKLAKAIGFADSTTSAYEFVLELSYDMMAHRNRISRASFSRKSSRTSIMKDTVHEIPGASRESPRLPALSEKPEPESEQTESEIPCSSTTIPSDSEFDKESSSRKKEKSPSAAKEGSANHVSSDDSKPPSRSPTPISHKDSKKPTPEVSMTPSESTDAISPSKQSSTETEKKDATPSDVTKASNTEEMSQVEQISDHPQGESSQLNESTVAALAGDDSSLNAIQSHPMSERATYLVIRNLQTSKLELMTTGDPTVVLSHCTQYWNGAEIKRLTRADRRTIHQVLYHWSNHQTFLCVGLSYRPVPTDYYKAVLTASAQVLKNAGPNAPRSIRTSHGTCQDRAKSFSSYDSDDMMDLEHIKHDQIWIGLVGLRHQPKPMAPIFVDQLDSSHIRFVYYSEESETRSKVFADKLGLETGWNSCITLKDTAKLDDAAKDESAIQKLPVGVSNIRQHLEAIDNVPLLVRLFVDATATNKAEMIDIADENGEIVFVMGTVSDPNNAKSFLQCPIGYGLLPVDHSNDDDDGDTSTVASTEQSSTDNFSDDSSDGSSHGKAKKHKKQQKNKRNAEMESAEQFLANEGATGSLVSDLLRLTCNFMSTKPNTFIDLLELIMMGRRLEQQTLMFAWLFFFSFCALNVHQLLSNIIFINPTLTGLQLYYLTFFIIPLQAFSLLWNARPPGLGDLISEKNVPKHKARIIRYTLYAVIRLLPLVLVCLVLFTWTLYFTWIPANMPAGAPSKLAYIFGATKGVAGYNAYHDPLFVNALSFSQNVTLVAFTLYIITASASCMHRTHSLLTMTPKRNHVWIVASVISVILAVVYFVIAESSHFNLFTKVNNYMYILLFGWIPCQILLDELVKRDTRAHFRRTQEILKLDYNTKLGMYSPI